jgi:copper oxidase (laccase) domain-containing protein
MKLNQEYGSDPQNILVYLSTSASVEAYEVNEKIAENWTENFKRIEKTESGCKYFLDIKKSIYSQLVTAGILEKNIEVSPNCSIKDHRYQSYRRDGQKTKFAIGFIGWAKTKN